MLQSAPASNFVQRSQDQFRIKQKIGSGGDLYECDTSLKGLVIGPESDVAEVIVYYYEPTEPNTLQSQSVSIRNPYKALRAIQYADDQSWITAAQVAAVIKVYNDAWTTG